MNNTSQSKTKVKSYQCHMDENHIRTLYSDGSTSCESKTGEGKAPRDTIHGDSCAQANRMLTEAKMPQSGIDRFCVLANDIFALAEDEFDGDAISAARELQTRIGGIENLKSYTDCLLVGNRKFGL